MPRHAQISREHGGPSAWSEVVTRLQADPLLDLGPSGNDLHEALRRAVREELCPPLLEQIAEALRRVVREELRRLAVPAPHEAVWRHGPAEGASPAHAGPEAPEEARALAGSGPTGGMERGAELSTAYFGHGGSVDLVGALARIRAELSTSASLPGAAACQPWRSGEARPSLAAAPGGGVHGSDGEPPAVAHAEPELEQIGVDWPRGSWPASTGAGDGATPAAGRDPEGTPAQQVSEPRLHVVAGESSRDMSSAPTDASQNGQSVWWEWERSHGKGWAPYSAEQSQRIEKGWLSGVSRMLVRSGNTGNVPMEIYFVDMVQLDPESGNSRRIRRIGEVSLRKKAMRLRRAVSLSLETGEPVLESFAQYRERQARMGSGSTLSNRNSRTSDIPVARRWMRQIIEDRSATSVFALSMLVTLCWCVFLGIDTQRYSAGTSVYSKDMRSIAIELCCSGFFLVELVIRFGACSSTWEFVRNAWNIIDTACVLGSLIDVVFVPVANVLVPGPVPQGTETELNVFRMCRLFKLLRILRLSRASQDVNIFIKGLLSGLKESAIVWAMLTGLVFVFSILLRTYARDEVREKVFGTMLDTMHRLVVTGIFLDDVERLMSGMLENGDSVGYMLFLIFVIISQYVLLNMLIGIIASVAGDVRGEEKLRAKALYLRHNLESVVECFIYDDGLISRNEFRLIIKNADVYKVLKRFGVEIEHLASMEESLYARTEHIDFDTLLEAIGQLNASKVATVRDIFQSQDVLKRALHSIDLRLSSPLRHRSKTT